MVLIAIEKGAKKRLCPNNHPTDPPPLKSARKGNLSSTFTAVKTFVNFWSCRHKALPSRLYPGFSIEKNLAGPEAPERSHGVRTEWPPAYLKTGRMVSDFCTLWTNKYVNRTQLKLILKNTCSRLGHSCHNSEWENLKKVAIKGAILLNEGVTWNIKLILKFLQWIAKKKITITGLWIIYFQPCFIKTD